MTNERTTMTCRELIDFISDYLEGALPPSTTREFERHLTICPSCVAYLDGYRKAIRLGRLAMARTEDPVGVSIPQSLVRAIRAARNSGAEAPDATPDDG